MRHALLAFWAALAVALSPMVAWGQMPEHDIIVAPPLMPPHVQECMGQSALASTFMLYRRAGLIYEESEESVKMSYRVMRQIVAEGGPDPIKPIGEMQTEALEVLRKVYDLDEALLAEDQRGPVLHQMMDDCVEENTPETPPRRDQRRMIPERSA